MPARGSIGVTMTRLFITSTSTMCAASAIALRHRIGVAALDVVGEIARRLGPDRRRPGGECREAVDHGVERLVVDLDQLGRLARGLRAVGDDEGHRIADMAHAAIGQRRPRRHDHRLDRRQARHVAQALGRKVGMRCRRARTPAQRCRRRNVDPLDDGMGMRRAQHVAVQAIRNRDVIDIAAAAGQEPRILEPAQRLADHLLLSAIAHVAPPDKLPPNHRRDHP